MISRKKEKVTNILKIRIEKESKPILFRSNDLEKAVKVFHEDTKDTFYSTYTEIMTAYAKKVVKNIS